MFGGDPLGLPVDPDVKNTWARCPAEPRAAGCRPGRRRGAQTLPGPDHGSGDAVQRFPATLVRNDQRGAASHDQVLHERGGIVRFESHVGAAGL